MGAPLGAQTGSALIEVTISLGIVLAAGLTALSFFQSTFLIARSVKVKLTPACTLPQCAPSGATTLCSCGDDTRLVIQ